MACCMTIRNCAQHLPALFKNIDQLRTLFDHFVLIVAYDNCTDDSERLLKQYQSACSFPVHLLKIDNPSPQRTVRIANARNACLEKLDTLDIHTHFMVDADEVNVNTWNIGLLQYYLVRDDWDALSFNRTDYYDIWALMYPPFQHHCWGFYEHSESVIHRIKGDITNRLDHCEEWIPCQSAFNGFAMYKTRMFKGIRYDGEYKHLHSLIPDTARESTLQVLSSLGPLRLDNHGEYLIHGKRYGEVCEHLYYHLSAIAQKNARIYISKYCLIE
jgi:hypothetical protein